MDSCFAGCWRQQRQAAVGPAAGLQGRRQLLIANKPPLSEFAVCRTPLTPVTSCSHAVWPAGPGGCWPARADGKQVPQSVPLQRFEGSRGSSGHSMQPAARAAATPHASRLAGRPLPHHCSLPSLCCRPLSGSTALSGPPSLPSGRQLAHTWPRPLKPPLWPPAASHNEPRQAGSRHRCRPGHRRRLWHTGAPTPRPSWRGGAPCPCRCPIRASAARQLPPDRHSSPCCLPPRCCATLPAGAAHPGRPPAQPEHSRPRHPPADAPGATAQVWLGGSGPSGLRGRRAGGAARTPRVDAAPPRFCRTVGPAEARGGCQGARGGAGGPQAGVPSAASWGRHKRGASCSRAALRSPLSHPTLRCPSSFLPCS